MLWRVPTGHGKPGKNSKKSHWKFQEKLSQFLLLGKGQGS